MTMQMHASCVRILRPLTFTIVLIAGCAKQQSEPKATNPSELRPTQVMSQAPAKPAPRLTGVSNPRKAVLDFLDWAGASTVSQEEEGRRVIAAAAGDSEIVKALSDEITAARLRDHSRALLGLSVLGEMRSRYAVPYLRSFIHLPLPAKSDHLIEGEDPAQTALATLQAKAIDGLAYMNTAQGDSDVFWAVSRHESRIVRAEAIRAFLMNHANSPDALAALQRYVRKGEEVFLDRPNRDPGETAELFNRQLDQYLRTHPELAPPRPNPSAKSGTTTGRYDFKQPPPRF